MLRFHVIHTNLRLFSRILIIFPSLFQEIVVFFLLVVDTFLTRTEQMQRWII